MMAGWRRLYACALEGTPESEEGKIGKSAAGLKGLRLLRREEIEDSEDDVCFLCLSSGLDEAARPHWALNEWSVPTKKLSF